MCKQLSLFPELATRVVSNLDELALQYVNSIPVPEEVEICNVEAFRGDVQNAYKAGASEILGDVIDLLKKYTDLHES